MKRRTKWRSTLDVHGVGRGIGMMTGLVVGSLLTAPPVGAQLKAALVGDPKVGEDAPDFALSYLTAQGPGPADQPFRLRAELGRTVVLLFATSLDSTKTRTEWQPVS